MRPKFKIGDLVRYQGFTEGQFEVRDVVPCPKYGFVYWVGTCWNCVAEDEVFLIEPEASDERDDFLLFYWD